jgi:hypothetical protein
LVSKKCVSVLVIAENPFVRVLFGIPVEDLWIIDDDTVIVVKRCCRRINEMLFVE